jgi:lipopolysaccharide export system permease protein
MAAEYHSDSAGDMAVQKNLSGNLMKRFDKYIMKEFLLPFLTVMLGFVLLFVLFDFSGRLNDFIEQKMTVQDVLYFYYLFVPQMVVVVMPVSLLLAIFHSFGKLSRNREIFALRAAGISLHRISRPLFIFSLICFLAVFFINERFVTKTYAETKEFQDRIEGEEEEEDTIRDRVFSYDGGTLIFEEFDAARMQLTGIAWDQPAAPDRDGIWLRADRGKWIGEQWWLYDVSVIYGNNLHSPVRAKRRMYEWGFTPRDILSEKMAEAMSFMEIWRNLGSDSGTITEDKRRQMRLQINQKLALPLLNMLVVLIGMPLCLKTKASGSIFIGLGLSLTLSFGYYGLFLIGKTLGHKGLMIEWLAIWYPNILFVALAGVLVARMEKG